MDLFTLFLLALGLSMDAFAVSVSNGMCYKNVHRKEAFTTSFLFGLFQALMPTIGYFAGRLFAGYIEAADHWIALILLGFIGGKMVFDGVKELRHPESCDINRTLTFRTMILQAIATSIDALAVGISLALINVNILAAAGFIGGVTFVCCVIGSLIGKKFGSLLKEKAEIFGGCILVLIGIKIFLEHTLGL